MIEVGVVIGKDGSVLRWHEPPGRTGGSIPDSEDLWSFIWANRDRIEGYAHTHPWNGPAMPSYTDTSTFEAIERALGRRLLWWVVTFDDVKAFYALHESWGKGPYAETADDRPRPWVEELRKRSTLGPPPPQALPVGSRWQRNDGPDKGVVVAILPNYPDDPEDMVRGVAIDPNTSIGGCKHSVRTFLERWSPQ